MFELYLRIFWRTQFKQNSDREMCISKVFVDEMHLEKLAKRGQTEFFEQTE